MFGNVTSRGNSDEGK